MFHSELLFLLTDFPSVNFELALFFQCHDVLKEKTGVTRHFTFCIVSCYLLVSPHFSVHCLQPQCEGRLEVEVDAASVF